MDERQRITTGLQATLRIYGSLHHNFHWADNPRSVRTSNEIYLCEIVDAMMHAIALFIIVLIL